MTSLSTDLPPVHGVHFNGLDTIDAEIARREAELERLRRDREEKAIAKLQERFAPIDECKAKLGLTTDAELIQFIRSRNLTSHSKAKRLPEASLKYMYYGLKNGATAPAAAKACKVSLATIHSRKKEWGLTHRTNVPTRPWVQAIKGFNPDKVTLPTPKKEKAGAAKA